MLIRAEQVGWYWKEEDMRVVMDDFGNPVVVPFCDWCVQNFDPI